MCLCILLCRSHFQSCSSLSLESSLINEHISLLERQLPIEVRHFVDLVCEYWLGQVRVHFWDAAISC